MSSLHQLATVAFWFSAMLVVYTYAVYPMVLWALTTWRRGPRAPQTGNDDTLPTVSVLIVAHNEERIIRARIENLLALDYPVDKLELAVASDGSRDRTADIVAEYAARGVRLFAYHRTPERLRHWMRQSPSLRVKSPCCLTRTR